MNRRHHSIVLAIPSKFVLSSSGIPKILNISVTKGPARPMKKLKTMTKRLHALGDLNKNVMQYVNPAAAGPKKMRVAIVPPLMPLSEVVNPFMPRIYIRAVIVHIGS